MTQRDNDHGRTFVSRDRCFEVSWDPRKQEYHGSINAAFKRHNDRSLKAALDDWRREVIGPAKDYHNRRAASRCDFKLSSLNLNDNSIGDEGIESLVQFLHENRVSTQIFKLYKNMIGDWGLICLSAYIEDTGKNGTQTIAELHLSDCYITRVGFRQLLTALTVNNQYPKLDKGGDGMHWVTPMWIRIDNNLIEDASEYMDLLSSTSNEDVKPVDSRGTVLADPGVDNANLTPLWISNETKSAAARGGLRGVRRAVRKQFRSEKMFINILKKERKNENWKGYRCRDADIDQFPVAHFLFLQKQVDNKSVPKEAQIIQKKSHQYRFRSWLSRDWSWGCYYDNSGEELSRPEIRPRDDNRVKQVLKRKIEEHKLESGDKSLKPGPGSNIPQKKLSSKLFTAKAIQIDKDSTSAEKSTRLPDSKESVKDRVRERIAAKVGRSSSNNPFENDAESNPSERIAVLQAELAKLKEQQNCDGTSSNKRANDRLSEQSPKRHKVLNRRTSTNNPFEESEDKGIEQIQQLVNDLNPRR